MIITAPRFLKLIEMIFSVKFTIHGLALLPFIFIRDKSYKSNKVLINHEKIHLRQQIELLFFGFIIWYYIAMIRKGYRNISFEREAYKNQRDLGYLKNRKLFSFYKYQI